MFHQVLTPAYSAAGSKGLVNYLQQLGHKCQYAPATVSALHIMCSCALRSATLAAVTAGWMQPAAAATHNHTATERHNLLLYYRIKPALLAPCTT